MLSQMVNGMVGKIVTNSSISVQIDSNRFETTSMFVGETHPDFNTVIIDDVKYRIDTGDCDTIICTKYIPMPENVDFSKLLLIKNSPNGKCYYGYLKVDNLWFFVNVQYQAMLRLIPNN